MKQIRALVAAVLIAVCMIAFCANYVKTDNLSVKETAATSAMTESIARSCYSTAQTRHDITTSATCYMSGYTQDRLLGRWWQGTCDPGYITINKYQTADNQQRVLRNAALGTPAGFVFESTFACLLPASANDANTLAVFEMYKASISDYAYVIDPAERISLIQNGYVENGILGRANNYNSYVRLKQCYQANNIHNWVYQHEACPSGYVEELVLDGSLLTNCDGQTDPQLTRLYKYYSATGSHRFLGTSATAPAGYNITPVGCFWAPTATASNKIPVYSYSFVQGADLDSRYASTSTTPTAPWVNDNTIIGYTFGRFYYIPETCPAGTTLSHIVSLIWTAPCIAANQLPLKAVVNGNVRRATLEPNEYWGSTAPGAPFVNEYIIGCVDFRNSYLPWPYPYNNLLTEASNGGSIVLTSYYDAASTPALYELYKSSTTDHKYSTYEVYRRIVGLNGFAYSSQPNFYPAERLYQTFRSCWNPTTTQREYIAGSCTGGSISEDFRFVAWYNFDSEPNLVRLFSFTSTSQTDVYYSTSATPPSGYTGGINYLAFIKSVQEVGTYPLYQFRKTGLSSGTDSFLRVNNTFVPPGYTQVGGILGYVFDAYPSTTNPIYDVSAYTRVKRCSLVSQTMDRYVLNNDACPQSYTDRGYVFKTLPCGSYNAVLGTSVEEFCQYNKAANPPSDTIIQKCSLGAPNTYTLIGSIGCLATQASSGLTDIYQRVVSNPNNPPNDIERYYDAASGSIAGETRTTIGYGLSG